LLSGLCIAFLFAKSSGEIVEEVAPVAVSVAVDDEPSKDSLSDFSASVYPLARKYSNTARSDKLLDDEVEASVVEATGAAGDATSGVEAAGVGVDIVIPIGHVTSVADVCAEPVDMAQWPEEIDVVKSVNSTLKVTSRFGEACQTLALDQCDHNLVLYSVLYDSLLRKTLITIKPHLRVTIH
jgi:hypothetical protein